MKNQMLLQAAAYLRNHRHKKVWYRIVTCMAAVVVFCTTYALILPAITMEKNLVCGLDEHTHNESCYAPRDPVLCCSAAPHVHSDSCFDDSGALICGEADYLIHTHGAHCYDSGSALVCTLEEIAPHVHGSGCYLTHIHGLECYVPEQGELLCTESTDPHVHGDECWSPVEILICDREEAEEHFHSDECYTPEEELVCTEADHEHGEYCYTVTDLLTCGLEEQEGHSHGDGCYETAEELTCGIEEGTIHTHTDDCYSWIDSLVCEEEGETFICAEPEIVPHEHTEACRDESGSLVCGQLQTSQHTHDESCVTAGEPELVCGLEEHTHDDVLCYIDETADVETEEAWLLTLPETLEGATYAEDLITVAESQLGYTESTRNVQVDPDGFISGYTRYGAWYGEPYGPWNTMFVSFCLHYAGVEEIAPEASAYRMVQALKEDSLYLQNHTPQPGDLMFLTSDDDENPDRAAIVVSVSEKEIRTIEGDTENSCVEYRTYAPDDETILGCCVLPPKPLADEPVPETTAPETETYLCGLEEHTHEETCYDGEGNLQCEAAEHSHSILCTMEPVAYLCGKDLHAHGESCYSEDGTLICTIEEHTHTAECLSEADLHCGREAHAHTEACFDAEENTVCGAEAHTHVPACWELSGEALSRVLDVIAAIDAIPSADEIDVMIAQFQEQKDEEGEISYLEQVYPQVTQAYWQYNELPENLRHYVVNADKLLELEYIWSVALYANTATTSTVYHINTYSTGTTQQTSGTVMFVGAPVASINGQNFTWWKEVVVEWSEGYMRVAKVNLSGSNASKVGHQATDTGFILLFHEGIQDGFPYNVAVGDYVTTDFFIHQDGETYSYNANGYGHVTFSRERPTYDIISDSTTVLQYQENGGRVAHTADFVDLNLYNYNYSVNDNWKENPYYPGFQWPGGAYMNDDNSQAYTSSTWNIGRSEWNVDRHTIDSVNFGDSIVANHQYANSKTAYDNNENGKYGKAVGATGVGKLYDYTSAQSVGKINWLWYDNNVADSTTNRPAGLSTTGKAIQFKLNNGAPITVDNISLKYLFPYDSAAGSTNAQGVTKQNSQSIDGLFQVNPISGLYYYNSRDNHAEYSNNKFTLYREKITPNFILYPFGNFMPFNSINTQSTQVGAFNNPGGMKAYVEHTVSNLQKWMADGRRANNYPTDPFAGVYGYSSRYQLGIMLNEYAEDWHLDGKWNTLTSGEALVDFFASSQGPAGASPTFTQEMLDNIYNIDWNEPSDFFFGMDMSMNFLMPKDGLTGHDNGNNSASWEVLADGTFKRTGSPDGIPDYPLVFNFAGDDDVWVFIDGILFLDLTGIHRHVGGTIDFETGMVYYFGLETATGDTSNNSSNANYYFAETFEEIINRSYSSGESAQKEAALAGLRPVLDSNGNQRYFENDTSRPMKTYKDYTTHTFKFFYMERGSGSSVCRINFNFPMLKKNSISVSKKNVPDEETIKAMGNPDYFFNIIKKGESDLFIKAGTKYTILDQYGNEVGTGTVDENGIFTIKAGQTAVFEGITENSGEYYVQELIKDEDYQLYGENVKVNGGELLANGIVNWDESKRPWYKEDTYDSVNDVDRTGPGGHTWHFYSSQYTNANVSSTFYFEMQNGVATSKLGSLSLGKKVQRFTEPTPDTYYRMYILLDDQPLTKDMQLDVFVGDEKTRQATVGHETVDGKTVSYIDLAENETALIPNIISGSRFRIWESAQSSAGFRVDYSADGGDEVQKTDSGITGIVRVDTDVQVLITNAEDGTQLEIPATKSFRQFAGGPYKYSFTLTESDKYGNKLDGGYSRTQEFEITGDNTQFTFQPITYLRHTFDTLPADRYYVVEETGETANGLDNTQKFLVKVMIKEDEQSNTDPKGITASVDTISEWNGTAWTETEDGINFLNTLTGDLSLTKNLEGVQNNQLFGFLIKLDPGTSGAEPLPTVYSATAYNADGTKETISLDLGGDCTIGVALQHGEKLVIHGIPIGAAWTITEGTAVLDENGGLRVEPDAPDGYLISGTVNGEPTDGPVASGSVGITETEVVVTNVSTYALPETGGPGTIPYTMAGLMLMLFSAAYLLYKTKKCRREVE